MARIDKYDPVSGGFRAPLAADWVGNAAPVAVGLDSSGRVVIGVGVAGVGIVGVVCLPQDKKAGTPVDVMQEGEIVEFSGVAGTAYTGLTTAPGTVGSTAADATHIRVGFTVEATRLVVRVAQ
jgi:hypothetical protein